MLDVSSNSLDFLDFLQSAECEEILAQNKLKIHVEYRYSRIYLVFISSKKILLKLL